jgi:hypothetical protein
MKRLTLIGLAVLLSVGCSIDKNSGRGPVILRMLKVQGAVGGTTAGTFQDVLRSDVQTGGGIFDDLAQLSFDAIAANPDAAAATSSSGQNDVLLRSYKVHYFRSDGHQTQGLDVPYDIAGSVSGAVKGGSTTPTNVVIEIVRHAAKNEPPLKTLVDSGGEDLIAVMAQITVYGQTVSGVNVSATGSLQIVFGDFADPAGTATPTPTP